MFPTRLSIPFAALSAVTLLSAPTFADQMPPRENLEAAKNIVIALESQVSQLVQEAQSGGQSGGGQSGGQTCGQIRNQRTCNATSGCSWSVRGDRGACYAQGGSFGVNADSAAGSINENDTAAEFALQGLGSGLFQLADLIDQADANWGTPAFWGPWQQACQKDGKLLFGAQAGKVSAQLPAQGFVTPADFDSIESELQDVRSQLFCP
jgi:hypothetical protein